MTSSDDMLYYYLLDISPTATFPQMSAFL